MKTNPSGLGVPICLSNYLFGTTESQTTKCNLYVIICVKVLDNICSLLRDYN